MSDEASVYQQVFGVPAPAGGGEFARVSQERVVDGLWSRPGLALRDRRLLTLAVVAASANDGALEAHVEGALRSGDLDLAALEEAAVHLAHYAGWPVGSRLAAAVEAARDRRRDRWRDVGPVGVVGVGALGADVAASLVDAGAEVVVHDARPEAAAAVTGARAASLADLGDACRIIGIVVRDGTQVLEVVDALAAGGPAGGPAGGIVLVHSTVSLDTVRTAHARAAAAGLDLLDVGLCRPAGLGSGLVAVVGGDPDVVARAAPVLGAVAATVHHLGPLGAGMAVKAVRNAVLYGAYAGVSEATDLCAALDVDESELLAALRDSGAAGSAALAFAGYRAAWTRGEHADLEAREGFVELARKDLGVVDDLARSLGVTAPHAAAVADAMPAAYLTGG